MCIMLMHGVEGTVCGHTQWWCWMCGAVCAVVCAENRCGDGVGVWVGGMQTAVPTLPQGWSIDHVEE